MNRLQWAIILNRLGEIRCLRRQNPLEKNNPNHPIAPKSQLHPNAMPSSIATELLRRANQSQDRAAYLTIALPAISAAAGGQYCSLVGAIAGRWLAEAEAGTTCPLPADLLCEVLDRDAPACRDHWVAIPVKSRPTMAEAIVLRTALPADAAQALPMLAELVPILAEALAAIDQRQHGLQRIRRLEAILEIANQWNQRKEVEPLLAEMAQASTRLLGVDRASIFLWDRRNHLLVGRPALGIKDGELRIPDDRGVVGQVVKTGEPCRVDATAEPQRIDRQVDSQLGYTTKTLLCVPLCGRSGELFGAFELINKKSGPFTADDEAALIELAAHAAIALENAQDRQQLLSTSRRITDQAAEQVRLLGESPTIEALRSIIRRVADTELAVLILGENGTGKEVVAQSIHYLSPRRDKPFIAVNCAAIPDTLAESELFGHEKGAFTDAHEARQGKFELAADGTLFLDEIGDLSLSGQSKLLRVLEEKVLVRVGGSASIHTDARVVAATNQNLAEMVRQKRFREDLYFRLNVVTIDLPPLRDRGDDVLLLAQQFLSDFCRKARRRIPEFSPAARERLQKHPWPGNVRELRNLMERLAYLSTEDRIEAEDLAFILSPRAVNPLIADLSQTLADATNRFQIEYITRAIQQCDDNMSQTATRLGLHRSNLYRKMRQLGMPAPE